MLKRALRGYEMSAYLWGSEERTSCCCIYPSFHSAAVRAACLPVFSFPILLSLLWWRVFETSMPVRTRQPMEKASQWEGRGSSSSCAGPGSCCPSTPVRACLQPAGANLLLLICSTVHSTATICPEGCINPLLHWWMTSTITICVETITWDSVNLKKLKAFDNTVYFSGVPCFSLITAASSAQISEWLLKASADNKQIYDMNLCHYHVNYDLRRVSHQISYYQRFV